MLWNTKKKPTRNNQLGKENYQKKNKENERCSNQRPNLLLCIFTFSLA